MGVTNKHKLGCDQQKQASSSGMDIQPRKTVVGCKFAGRISARYDPWGSNHFWSWYHMISYTACLRTTYVTNKCWMKQKNITSQGPQGPRSFQDMRTSPPEVANKDIVALLWFHALRLIDHFWYCMIQTCTVYLTSRWSLVFVRSDVLMQKNMCIPNQSSCHQVVSIKSAINPSQQSQTNRNRNAHSLQRISNEIRILYVSIFWEVAGCDLRNNYIPAISPLSLLD